MRTVRHGRRSGVTRRAALAGIAAGAASLTGCLGGKDDRKIVKFWGLGREGQVAEELFADFERAHPDIRVIVQKLPWNSAHEKYLTAYAGDTLPDVGQMGATWIAEFVALDALEPLDAFAEQSSAVPLGDFFDGIVEANRIDSRLFGLPWYVDTRLLFYRQDLLRDAGFEAPPVTWDEWRRMLAAIKARVGANRYAVLLPINEYDQVIVLALQQPAEMLRDGGRYGNFRSDDFKRALSFYAEIFRHDWAPRMTNTQLSNVWDEFGNGLFSFYASGPWNIAEFRKRLPERLQNAWMTAPMPGPDGPGVSSAGGASVVIFRASERKREAWLLTEYLSHPDTQAKFYELTGDMPPRKAAWEIPALAQSPYARAFREQFDRVRAAPKVPEWERIATEIRITQERLVQGLLNVDQAAEELDRKADAILEKRRWMLERAAKS